MYQNLISSIIVILILFSSGCKREKIYFDENRKYIGFWYETQWTYNFKSTGEYILETEGHLGGDSKSGLYLIKGSIILLISETEYFEDWRYKRLKIINKTSVRDYWGNYYCKTGEELIEVSEKRFEEEQLLEETIEGLEIVLNKKKELLKRDSTKEYRLRNKGIIIKNGNEFFEYQIESWFPEIKRNAVHIRVYAKFNPIRIYNDSFELIKE